MNQFPIVPARYFDTTAKSELYAHLLATKVEPALATRLTDKYDDVASYIEALYQHKLANRNYGVSA